MGAASYIGRVGGLAVALGVGTAIAMGNGVAAADTTDSSPSPSTDSSSSTSTIPRRPYRDSSVDPSRPPKPTDSTTPPSRRRPRAPTVAEGVVSAQTNTGTSDTTDSTESHRRARAGVDAEETHRADRHRRTRPTEEPTSPPKTRRFRRRAGGPRKSPSRQKTSTGTDTSRSTHDSRRAPLSISATRRSARTTNRCRTPLRPTRKLDNVAVFVDARALAAAGPINLSPMMAARTAQDIHPATTPTPAAAPDLLTAAVDLVSSVVNWVLNPLGGQRADDTGAAPLIWGLLAFARREFDNFFNALAGRPADDVPAAVPEPTSFALAAHRWQPRPSRGRGPPARPSGPQRAVSPSTQFVDWVTGHTTSHPLTDNPLLAIPLGVTRSGAPTSASCGTTALPTTRPPRSTSTRC